MRSGSGSGAVACLLRSRSEDVRVYSKTFDRSFHWLWLRDHCQCSLCVDSFSGQKLHSSGSVIMTVRSSAPLAARVEGRQLCVDWSDHAVRVPLELLGLAAPAPRRRRQNLRSAAQNLRSASASSLGNAADEVLREPLFHTRPSISFVDMMQDKVGRAWTLRTVNSSGLVFVDDIPQPSTTAPFTALVTQLASRLAPVMDTFYGRHWDVRDVAGADNVAYTSKQLGWHQDLLYFESPPGLQLLHCLEAATTGGETLFLDGVAAANAFEREYPEDFVLLSKLHITYQYSNAQVSLTQRRPVFAPATDQFSHRRVFWSPAWQGPLNLHRNVSRVYLALNRWDQLLDKQNVLAVKMQPGTAVIFDNHRFGKKDRKKSLFFCL